MEQVSVIVPAYNEEETLGRVLKGLEKLDLELRVVVVDDGSKDKTAEVAEELGFDVIRHKKNRGKGAAIRTGIDNVDEGVVVIQDADLEYDPKEIPRLLGPIEKGEADVVYGSRFLGEIEGMKKSHYFGNWFLSLATSVILGKRITDMETGYKAFAPGVLESLDLESDEFDIEPEITAKVIKGGYRLVEVPIDFKARTKGEKKISWVDGVKGLFKLVRYSL